MMPEYLKIVLKILAFALVILQIGAYLFQEKLIFFPEKLDASFPFKFEHPFEEIFLKNGDAVLSLLRFRVAHPKGIIVYFHGNAGSLRDWGWTADSLVHFGYDVLIFDYRGFGKSTSRLQNETDLLGDSRAVLEVARKEFPDEKIVLFGRSLGTGIATCLAAEFHPRQLVLESPYLSLASRARAMFPVVLPFILKYPLRSDLYAKKVSSPVLILHGTDDEVVPFSSGEMLSRVFTSPMTFVRISGGMHNGLEQFSEYQAALARVFP